MDQSTSIIQIDINNIIPNKYQPRKNFDELKIEELASSIKTYGIINPILLRKIEDKYEIIAGERRYRAAKKCGLPTVPAIVKNIEEQQMAELALLENLQRQELSPIEEAKSYEQIMKLGNMTQQEIAIKLGKSQPLVANKIRLLQLPQEVQNALALKQISERHARSLININDKEKQLEILKKIIDNKLTVKETDNLINETTIDENEIKNAISEIMKTLKREEKEENNMNNNGNFFPNFDNNMSQNTSSLNMMNSQAMNNQYVDQENVMPTTMPQFNQPMEQATSNMQFTQKNQVNNQFQQNSMLEQATQQPSDILQMNQLSVPPQMNINFDQQPMMAPPILQTQQEIIPTNALPFEQKQNPIINDQPLFVQNIKNFNPPLSINDNTNSQEQPTMTQSIDQPLFNFQQPLSVPDQSILEPSEQNSDNMPQLVTSEEIIPVTNSSNNQKINETFYDIPVNISPIIESTSTDKLSKIQELLSSNKIDYKLYSNEDKHCIIIEF